MRESLTNSTLANLADSMTKPNPSRSRMLRPLRDRLGAWLDARIDAVARERVLRELAVAREADLTTLRLWGPSERLHIARTAVLNDALLNTISGSITVGEHAFFGHGVSLLTGTHDVSLTGLERQLAVPEEGRDIVIGPGAWITSRAVVLGPCRIGANAVVAAGAVVNINLPAGAIAAGVPARVVGHIDKTGHTQR